MPEMTDENITRHHHVGTVPLPQNILGHGTVICGISVERLPDIPGQLVKVKALGSNLGKIALGGRDDLTAGFATDNETDGLQLCAGDSTDWMPLSNLNVVYVRGTIATDGVTFCVLG